MTSTVTSSSIFTPNLTEDQKVIWEQCSKEPRSAHKVDCSPLEKVFLALKRSDYYANYQNDYSYGLLYADEALRVANQELRDVLTLYPHINKYVLEDTKAFASLNINSLLSLSYLKKAQCWKMLKRDYRDTINMLEKALEYDPNRFEAYNQMGILYMQLQEWSKAVTALDFVCSRKVDPDVYSDMKVLKYHSLCNKSIALSNLNMLKESIECLQEAIQLDPNGSTALEYMLNIEYECGNIDKATEIHNSINSLKKSKSFLNAKLESSLKNRNVKYVELKRLLDKARACFLNSNLTKCLSITKESVHSIKEFESFQNLGEDLCDPFEVKKLCSKLYRLKAYVEMKVKFNKKVAVESIDKAIAFDPKHLNLYFDKARFLHWLGEDQTAIEIIDQALETTPKEPNHYYIYVDLAILKSRILEGLGQRDEALKCLNDMELLCDDCPLSLSFRKSELLCNFDNMGECLRELSYLEHSASKETLLEFKMHDMKKVIPPNLRDYVFQSIRSIPTCSIL